MRYLANLTSIFHRPLLAAVLLLAPVVATVSLPIPSAQAALGGSCQASEENRCCRCNDDEGFCDSGANIGSVSCTSTDCPTNPHCVFRVE